MTQLPDAYVTAHLDGSSSGVGLYPCVAVDDWPKPSHSPSSGTCGGCGREVWFDGEGFARQLTATLPDSLILECTACCGVRVRAGEIRNGDTY